MSRIQELEKLYHNHETISTVADGIKNGLTSGSFVVRLVSDVRVELSGRGKKIERMWIEGAESGNSSGSDSGSDSESDSESSSSSDSDGDSDRDGASSSSSSSSSESEAPPSRKRGRRGGSGRERKFSTAKVDDELFASHPKIIAYLSHLADEIVSESRGTTYVSDAVAGKEYGTSKGKHDYANFEIAKVSLLADTEHGAHGAEGGSDGKKAGSKPKPKPKPKQRKEPEKVYTQIKVVQSMNDTWEEQFSDRVLVPLARQIMDQWLIAGFAVVRFIPQMESRIGRDMTISVPTIPVIVPFSRVVIVHRYEPHTQESELLVYERDSFVAPIVGGWTDDMGVEPIEGCMILPFEGVGDKGELRSKMESLYRTLVISMRHELLSLEGHSTASRPAMVLQPEQVNFRDDIVTGSQVVGGDVQRARLKNDLVHATLRETLLVSQQERHRLLMKPPASDLRRMATDPVLGIPIMPAISDDPSTTPMLPIPVGFKAAPQLVADTRFDRLGTSRFTIEIICARFGYPVQMIYPGFSETAAYNGPMQLQIALGHYRGALSRAIEQVVERIIGRVGKLQVTLPSSTGAETYMELLQKGLVRWDAVREPLAKRFGMDPTTFTVGDPVPDEIRHQIVLQREVARFAPKPAPGGGGSGAKSKKPKAKAKAKSKSKADTAKKARTDDRPASSKATSRSKTRSEGAESGKATKEGDAVRKRMDTKSRDAKSATAGTSS